MAPNSGRSLAGCNMLVTGGASGIGAAAVDAYVAQGAQVTVLDRAQPTDPNARVRYIDGDATDGDDIERAIAAAREAGGPELTNLTCCAGIFDHYADIRSLDTTTLAAAATEIWRVNVYSALLAVKCAYTSLERGSGSVTLTLSSSAFYPHGGGVLYGSSKWALRGVVCHLARQLAPRVRVNGVAPGGTGGTSLRGPATLGLATLANDSAERDARIRDATALKVLPTPEDHAAAYAYLADPNAARVVTGLVITSDGGLA